MAVAISSKGGRSEGSGRSEPTGAAVSVRDAMPLAFVPPLLSIQSLWQSGGLPCLLLTVHSIVIPLARRQLDSASPRTDSQRR